MAAPASGRGRDGGDGRLALEGVPATMRASGCRSTRFAAAQLSSTAVARVRPICWWRCGGVPHRPARHGGAICRCTGRGDPGHEVVGEVVAFGAEVDVRGGDRVGIAGWHTCGCARTVGAAPRTRARIPATPAGTPTGVRRLRHGPSGISRTGCRSVFRHELAPLYCARASSATGHLTAPELPPGGRLGLKCRLRRQRPYHRAGRHPLRARRCT